MAEPEIPSRKAYRQGKRAAEADRDAKRVAAERAYAKEMREKKPRAKAGRFDDATFNKINSLKKRLNWAIGIVVVLLFVVAFVLFKL